MRTIYINILAAAALLFALAAPSMAETPHQNATLVVNITTDDVWTSQMALNLARRVQDDGGSVVVFLNVRAVGLANAKVAQHTGAVTGKTAQGLLADIIAGGGQVFVCPMCTEQAGLSIEDRVAGVMPGGAPFREILMAPGTRIISF